MSIVPQTLIFANANICVCKYLENGVKSKKTLAEGDECMFDGKKMRRKRLKMDMTAKDLSQLTGISAAHLLKYERGEKKPIMENWDKIARALDCGLPELAKDEDRMRLASAVIYYTPKEKKLLEEYRHWKHSVQQKKLS